MIRKNAVRCLGFGWDLGTGLLCLLLPLSTLAGLLFLGKLARDDVAALDRYRVPFHRIDCAAPPGQDKDNFLDEVQYLAGLPDELRLLDDDLPRRLAEAFARHPWVEQVERVTIRAPAQVQVRLVFRTPVLKVSVPGRTLRIGAVDRHGILLPSSAELEGLPLYDREAAPPAGPAGTAWGDPAVEAAARNAAQGQRKR